MVEVVQVLEFDLSHLRVSSGSFDPLLGDAQ